MTTGREREREMMRRRRIERLERMNHPENDHPENERGMVRTRRVVQERVGVSGRVR